MSDATALCMGCGFEVFLDVAHYVDWRTYHPSCCPDCRKSKFARHRHVRVA